MIAAQGFAAVMQATGDIQPLVDGSMKMFGGSKGMAAFAMLFVGLLVTMGIGSSFSTLPIITAIYVPLCISLGFSPLATVAIVGTAGALGDAGSPASDSTLGPTMGLDADAAQPHARQRDSHLYPLQHPAVYRRLDCRHGAVMEQLEERITELEIRLALQDELLASLNDTVADLRQTLDLQQAQLRLLYQRQQQAQDAGKPFAPQEEIPPHY